MLATRDGKGSNGVFTAVLQITPERTTGSYTADWRSNKQSERAPQTAAAVENPQNSRVDLAGFNKYHIEQWWKLFNQSQNTSSDIPS